MQNFVHQEICRLLSIIFFFFFYFIMALSLDNAITLYRLPTESKYLKIYFVKFSFLSHIC